MVAVPTVPGVSPREVRAPVNPESRVTWVILPLDRSLIWASGLESSTELDAAVLDEESLEHAVSGTRTNAAAAKPRLTRLTMLIEIISLCLFDALSVERR